MITAHNVSQLVQAGSFGSGIISGVTVSPTGDMFAAASTVGVNLHSADTFQTLGRLETGAEVANIAFSRDGTVLAAGLSDGTFQLWRVGDQALVRVEDGYEGNWDSRIAFSPASGLIAVSGRDNYPILWLWDTEDPGFEIRVPLHNYLGSPVAGLAFSRDGSMLAGSLSDAVQVWRVAQGGQLTELRVLPITASSLAFSNDDTLLATGTDQRVILWDVSTGERVHTFSSPPGVSGDLCSLSFSPDGSVAAAGIGDSLLLGHIESRQLLNTSTIVGTDVRSVLFLPESGNLVTGERSGIDFTVHIWDGTAMSLLAEKVWHGIRPLQLLYTSESHLRALGTMDRFDRFERGVRVMDVFDGSVLEEYPSDGVSSTLAARLRDDGLATAALIPASDGSILLSLAIEGNNLGSVPLSVEAAPYLAVFAPSADLFAAASLDGQIRVRTFPDAQLTTAIELPFDEMRALAISRDGRLIAGGTRDADLMVWSLPDGEVVFTLSGLPQNVSTLEFSGTGEYLAVSLADATAYVWHADSATLGQLMDPGAFVSGSLEFEFSPGGDLLAVGDGDGRISFWDTRQRTLNAILDAHTDRVTSLLFFPDGDVLVSGSREGTVRLWSVPH